MDLCLLVDLITVHGSVIEKSHHNELVFEHGMLPLLGFLSQGYASLYQTTLSWSKGFLLSSRVGPISLSLGFRKPEIIWGIKAKWGRLEIF